MTINPLPKRLDVQIATMISLLLMLFISIWSLFDIRHSFASLKESLATLASISANYVAENISNSDFKTDTTSYENVLTKALKYPQIDSISVLDTKGNLIASAEHSNGSFVFSTESKKIEIPANPEEQAISDNNAINRWAAFDDGSLTGWVIVKVNMQKLDSHFTDHIQASLIFAFLMIVGTYSVVLLLLRKPFLYIKDAAKFAQLLDDSSRGSLKPYPAVEELQSLGEALNLASRRLAVHEKEILSSLELLETQTYAMDQHSIVSIADTLGKITYANNKFCQISEYNKAELLGKNHSLLKSGHHNNTFFQDLWRTISSGNVWQGEICNKSRSGKLYWTNTTIVPFVDKNNIPYQYVAIRNDITAQKKAAEKIESLARFPFEDPNPIMRISHNMQLIYSNPAAIELLSDWKINTGEPIPDNIISIARSTVNNKQNSTSEIELNNQFYSVTITYVPDSSYLNLYVKDITQRKAAEQTIKNYQRHLEDLVDERTESLVNARDAALAAERSMSTFLANMSHELRTPLHAVMSFAEFGMKKIDRVSKEKIVQYFFKIHQSGNHLLGLVNNLLDLSKLRAGKMSYHYTDSLIAPVIAETINELSLIALKKNIEIIFNSPDTEIKTYIDTDRIAQVMRNLMSNAIKFSEHSKVLIKLTSMDNHWIEISVADNGIGIPESELEIIFESFVQSSKTDTRAGGTGLGLPICKEIIEAGHGGWIKAANKADGGAVFTFRIPIQLRENEPSYLSKTDIKEDN